MPPNVPAPGPTIAIIGSGFAGLCIGHSLKQAGLDSFTIFEKAEDLGGVWRDNTYPGAACDVPSHLYSFSFEPHYPWAYRYGKQTEILDYLRHCAKKYDLLRHIRFSHTLADATFDEARALWTLRFSDGRTHEAQVVITAVGQLHTPHVPKIKGLESFAGAQFHSARWNHAWDPAGKTVGVIGNGASAVQFVPAIAGQVKQLAVFQRSTSWVIPKVDRRYTRLERMLLDTVPLVHDLDRGRIFWLFEGLATALQPDRLFSRVAGAVIKLLARVLLWAQVKNPALRKKLAPSAPIGCKRTLLSSDWLPALARPNVEVVTDDVVEVTPRGLRTADGREREFDTLIFGTGFKATEFLAPIEFVGRGGQSLRKRWERGAAAYLGVTVAGFPNLFLMYGPNTNLGAGSLIFMLECQAGYIAQCIAALRDRSLRFMDVRPEAERAFNDELRAKSKISPYESGCHNWYVNADGHNTNNWIGYMTEYKRLVRRPDFESYELAAAGPG